MDTLELRGETVTISYVADPVIGHGEFQLKNQGEKEIIVSVKSAWLRTANKRLPLRNITVYNYRENKNENADAINVGAGETLNFYLGFPQIAYEPAFGESVEVVLNVKADGNELTAESKIKFVKRIPIIH